MSDLGEYTLGLVQAWDGRLMLARLNQFDTLDEAVEHWSGSEHAPRKLLAVVEQPTPISATFFRVVGEEPTRFRVEDAQITVELEGSFEVEGLA